MTVKETFEAMATRFRPERAPGPPLPDPPPLLRATAYFAPAAGFRVATTSSTSP